MNKIMKTIVVLAMATVAANAALIVDEDFTDLSGWTDTTSGGNWSVGGNLTYSGYASSGNAAADLEAKLQFEAWLTGFKGHMSAIAAAMAQADIVITAGEGIVDAAGNVIMNAAGEIDLENDPIGAYRVATCLSGELGDVQPTISKATANLNASVQASGSLMASLGK